MRPPPLVATATRIAWPSAEFSLTRGDRLLLGAHVVAALLGDDLAIGGALARIVDDLLGQLVEGELLAAILAEQADRVGAALAAMAHQLRAAFEPVLQGLQLHRRRAALAGQAEMRAVRRIGDQRHDVVQEGAARLHPAVDLDQVLVVDPRDHHRVDLDQDAARGQHFEAEHLPLVQDRRRLDARSSACADRRSTDRSSRRSRDRPC